MADTSSTSTSSSSSNEALTSATQDKIDETDAYLDDEIDTVSDDVTVEEQFELSYAIQQIGVKTTLLTNIMTAWETLEMKLANACKIPTG